VPKLCPGYAFLALLARLANSRISNLHILKGTRKNESLSLRHHLVLDSSIQSKEESWRPWQKYPEVSLALARGRHLEVGKLLSLGSTLARRKAAKTAGLRRQLLYVER
jgi:hypothetical protein